MLAFLTPRLLIENGLGEFSIGRTAGRGIDGAGDAERRTEGDEPKEERRLCEMMGGFIGNASDAGDGGIEVAGDAGAREGNSGPPPSSGRGLGSGGAGLLVEILRAGRSILVILLCWFKVGWPSLVLRLYM